MVSGRTMSAAPIIGAAPRLAIAPRIPAAGPSQRRTTHPKTTAVARAKATVTARPIRNNPWSSAPAREANQANDEEVNRAEEIRDVRIIAPRWVESDSGLHATPGAQTWTRGRRPLSASATARTRTPGTVRHQPAHEADRCTRLLEERLSLDILSIGLIAGEFNLP